jgi:hypothetical protein
MPFAKKPIGILPRTLVHGHFNISVFSTFFLQVRHNLTALANVKASYMLYPNEWKPSTDTLSSLPSLLDEGSSFNDFNTNSEYATITEFYLLYGDKNIAFRKCFVDRGAEGLLEKVATIGSSAKGSPPTKRVLIGMHRLSYNLSLASAFDWARSRLIELGIGVFVVQALKFVLLLIVLMHSINLSFIYAERTLTGAVQTSTLSTHFLAPFKNYMTLERLASNICEGR